PTQGSQLVGDDLANLFHVFVTVNTMAFEIDEEPVLAGVIGEPSLDRHSQQLVAQTHWTARENTLIHHDGIADDWAKLHPADDIALDVDTGRDFDQLKPIRHQFEHTAL